MTKKNNVNENNTPKKKTTVSNKSKLLEKQKYHLKSDPNAKNEAEKYDDPIPSRDIISQYLTEKQQHASFLDIAQALGLRKKAHKEALSFRLKAMERDGQLLSYKQEIFKVFPNGLDNHITGKVIAKKEGNGQILSKNNDSLYLSHMQMRKVFNGDTVEALPWKMTKDGLIEGVIIKIIKRDTFKLSGHFNYENDTGSVLPVNILFKQTIALIENKECRFKDIPNDSLVNVEILSQPSMKTQPVGRVTEILGVQNSIDESMAIAVETYHLEVDFSKETQTQVSKFPDCVLEEELKNRKDLRDLPFVTIDGEDARDFDDAVYAHSTKTGGWKLFVAIADVSAYVSVDSPLDKDAKKRSTSVYFPSRVVPMLPEKLSNELCSLQPKVDRLALICEMNISANGKLSKTEFYSGVINSKARLTYTEVLDLLENDGLENFENKYSGISDKIFDLYGLYLILKKQRYIRGSIDFDTIETRIIFNDNEEILSIEPSSRNEAHKLIEECMLLANVATAKFLLKNEIPALYRIHAKPMPDRVETLRKYLKSQKLSLGTHGKTPTPKDYAQMLKDASDMADFDNIQMITLRTMNQAVYSPDNEGHFGLSYDSYSHFTSPIRRYPDLVTHRAIKSLIKEQKLGGYRYEYSDLSTLGEHCSTLERNANNAARTVEDWLKCQFLKPQVGEEFKARIVSVLGFGMFVRMNDNYIDGLVHVKALGDDYFVFDETKHMMIGERTKKTYKLGDLLDVKLVRVDTENFQIDFEIVGNEKSSSNKKSKSFYKSKKNKTRKLK